MPSRSLKDVSILPDDSHHKYTVKYSPTEDTVGEKGIPDPSLPLNICIALSMMKFPTTPRSFESFKQSTTFDILLYSSQFNMALSWWPHHDHKVLGLSQHFRPLFPTCISGNQSILSCQHFFNHYDSHPKYYILSHPLSHVPKGWLQLISKIRRLRVQFILVPLRFHRADLAGCPATRPPCLVNKLRPEILQLRRRDDRYSMCDEDDGPAQQPLDEIPAEPEPTAGESRIPHKIQI